MTRILLIDGDEIAWRGAARLGKAGRVDAASAREEAARRIAALTEALAADGAVVALSDRENWRRDLDPSYKAARRERPRPPALDPMRAALCEAHGAVSAPRLEADDLLGLWATGGLVPGATRPELAVEESAGLAVLRQERAARRVAAEERVVVSSDKDLRGVPGLHGAASGRLARIAPIEAARAHLTLALAGDPVDGYPGCPGIGPKRAAARLAAAEPSLEGFWEAVLAAYAERDLGPGRALLQARLARVLQAGDLDPSGAPRLWRPPAA